MKFIESQIDSERVVIASALLVGGAIWTAWRHLILPALVAVCGLLLVLAGWRPEPAPALEASGDAMDAVVYCSAAMVLAEQRASGDAMEAVAIPARARRAAIGFLTADAPSPDLPLPQAVQRRILRASLLGSLSRHG